MTVGNRVIDALHDGLTVVSHEGIILLWNRAMETYFGIQAAQALGRPILTVLPFLEDLGPLPGSNLNTGSASHSEQELRCPEGTGPRAGCIFRVRISALEDGLLLYFSDISERVDLERRLISSERLASIGKLASGVAHELNNPLDGVIRYVNLTLDLLEGEGSPQEYLLNARQGLTRMVKIIRSLLEFSRHATISTPTIQDVNEVIQEAIKLSDCQRLHRDVQVVTFLEKGLLPITDYGMEHVVSNLLKNAIDSMPGGGTVRISSKGVNGYVVVTVSDTGGGIPEDIRDSIFEPFFTTKEIGKGAGLGLAICKEIIDRCDGSIEVESEPGKGATFLLRIPCVPDEVAGILHERTGHENREGQEES
ncbi:MAG: PAS domain-containing protein [Candidatus Omnitrophica bacterium]|nr:PAS domain-containing protein [Candidatus Omnitrophota bacterium]